MEDIRTLSKESLSDIVAATGQPAFRTQQIWNWLWKNFCTSFDDMQNIPQALRTHLKKHYRLTPFEVVKTAQDADGTLKIIMAFHDSAQVEAVLIPGPSRLTACISTQVGCSGGCSFCATAAMGLQRNLNTGEIYAQVVALNKSATDIYGKTLTNIVIMGMGEPLLNYQAVEAFCNILTSEEGMHFSAQRITLSTVGFPKKIRELADANAKCNLAISLHATDDNKRNELIPLSKAYTTEELLQSLIYYTQKTKKTVTFEYILLKGCNDSVKDAEALAKICKRLPSKVNIISYNPHKYAFYEKASGDATKIFIEILEGRHINVRLRKSRGDSINAACGQLVLKEIAKNQKQG